MLICLAGAPNTPLMAPKALSTMWEDGTRGVEEGVDEGDLEEDDRASESKLEYVWDKEE